MKEELKTVRISIGAHKKLKLKSAKSGKSIKEILEELVDQETEKSKDE